MAPHFYLGRWESRACEPLREIGNRCCVPSGWSRALRRDTPIVGVSRYELHRAMPLQREVAAGGANGNRRSLHRWWPKLG